jgi:hypothetical protein
VFQDERGGPRQPVRCHRCGTTVLVRKNSLAHTVVQWTTSTDACTELAGASARACPFLADSIDAAVRAGELEVADLARSARD